MIRHIKPVLVFALLMAAHVSAWAAPGDKPISQLPTMSDTDLTLDDLLVTVDNPSGTPVTKRITLANVNKAFTNALGYVLRTNPVIYFGGPPATKPIPTWSWDGATRYQWNFYDNSPLLLVRRDPAPNRVIYMGGVNGAVGPDAISVQMTGPIEGNVDPRFTVHFGEDFGYSFNTNRVSLFTGGQMYSNSLAGLQYFGDTANATTIRSSATVDIPKSIKFDNNVPLQIKDSSGNYQNIMTLNTIDDLVLGAGTTISGITTGDKNFAANIVIGAIGMQVQASNAFLVTTGRTYISHVTASNLTYVSNFNKGIINISAFGAAGNGIPITRCSMTSGLKTLDCPTASFTSGDIGKLITVYQAGTANQNLTTIITNVNSSTQVTLSNAAITTVGAVSAVYGTDDSTPVQNALNAMAILGKDLEFNDGIYLINRALQDTGTNSLHHNAQLYLPDIPASSNGFFAKRVKMTGPIHPRGRGRGGFQTNDITYAGAVLMSTLSRGPDVNAGRMIDTKNFTSATATSPRCNGEHYDIPYNNICVDVENLSFYGCFDNNITLLDLSALPSASIKNCLFFGGFSDSGSPQPTGTNGYAAKLSSTFTENLNVFDENEIYSFYNGLGISSSTLIGMNWITTCFNALNAWDSSAAVPVSCTFLQVYSCKNVLMGGQCETHITGNIAVHNNVDGWWNPIICVNDPAPALTGNPRFYVSSSVTNGFQVIGGGFLEAEGVGNIHNGTYRPTVKRGPSAIQTAGDNGLKYTLGLGADTAARSLTFNTLKYFGINAPRYQETNYNDTTVISYQGFNADNTFLGIGGDQGTYGNKGVNGIRFYTATDGATAPAFRWVMDSSGRLISQNQFAYIGESGTAIPRAYATNLIAENTIYAGAGQITNVSSGSPLFGTSFGLLLSGNANDAQYRLQTGSAHAIHYGMHTENTAAPDGGSFFVRLIAPGGVDFNPVTMRTNGTVYLKNNVTVDAILTTTNGMASVRSNKVDTIAISVGASVFHWTNTTAINVFAFIDGNVATTASLGINSGTALFATKSAWTIPLQPGESFDLTYTGSAPTARWKAW